MKESQKRVLAIEYANTQNHNSLDYYIRFAKNKMGCEWDKQWVQAFTQFYDFIEWAHLLSEDEINDISCDYGVMI